MEQGDKMTTLETSVFMGIGHKTVGKHEALWLAVLPNVKFQVQPV